MNKKMRVAIIVTVVAAFLIMGAMPAFGAPLTKSLHWPSDSKTVVTPYGYQYPNVFTRYGSRLPLPLYRSVSLTIQAPSKSPVYAMESGIVKKVVNPAFPYFGNTPYIVIEHTDATTGEAFTSSYIYVTAVPGLLEGMIINEGAVIGAVLQPFTGTRDPLPPTGPMIVNVRQAPFSDFVYPAYNLNLGTSLPQNPKYNPRDPHYPELFVDPAGLME